MGRATFLLLSAVVAIACAVSPFSHMEPLMLQQDAMPSVNSPCGVFGFDNDLACLYCSVEELLPLMHAKDIRAIPMHQLAPSAACIKVCV